MVIFKDIRYELRNCFNQVIFGAQITSCILLSYTKHTDSNWPRNTTAAHNWVIYVVIENLGGSTHLKLHRDQSKFQFSNGVKT